MLEEQGGSPSQETSDSAPTWYEARLIRVMKNREARLELPLFAQPESIIVSSDNSSPVIADDPDKDTSLKSKQLFLTMLRLEFVNLGEHVRHLDLSGNALPRFYVELCDLHLLETLELRDNAITTIPSDILRLSRLQQLGMRNNLLTTLPPELGNPSSTFFSSSL